MVQVDLIIAIPLAGALIAAFSGRFARWIALATSIATAGVVLSLAGSGVFGGEIIHGITGSENAALAWVLTLDGLSLPLVALTAFLGVIAILASWDLNDRPAAHHAMLLLLQSMVAGVFLAEQILMFYVFWEAVLIPMYFLIGIWGHENRKHAAAKFFIYTFAGSVLMLLGILLATNAAGSTLISVMSANAGELPGTAVYWLFLAGMLVKIPAFPLHTWLPDAHVEAPTAGSIMLAGVLLKMGGYGLLRLALPFAPAAWADSRWVLAALGVIGIVYGAAMALAQHDLKRLVAYSSVSHMGFVLLAVSVGTTAALGAAMLVMVSHGVVAGLLFLLVGQLYDRTHTRELARFGGLGHSIPAWSVAFTFGALASLGLPALSGFPGEFLTMIEAFGFWGWWLLPATVGIVLAAAYNLRAVRGVAHGPLAPEWEGLVDLTFREWLPVALLAASILALGIWPRAVLDVSLKALTIVAAAARAGVSL